jgi:hypothetical protein
MGITSNLFFLHFVLQAVARHRAQAAGWMCRPSSIRHIPMGFDS